MENPFKYGGIVRGEYFADREDEIRQLEREAVSSGRVFLISPRRFGKTCLLFNLMDRLRKRGIPAAYLDLNAYPELGELAAVAAVETARGLESNLDRLTRILSGLKHIRPRLEVAGDGTISVSAEIAGRSTTPLQALLEALDHAETLAAGHQRTILIIFDEFSDLPKYDGEKLEKALRSAIQRHEHLAYVMAGSAQSVMLSMVREQGRPFYKLGRVMELGPIPREPYSVFIRQWLERGGFNISDNGLERLLTLGRDVPHNIQRLCHTLWESGCETGEVDMEQIEAAPYTIAREDSPLYEMLWQNTTLLQRSLLIALASDPGASPFSKEFMSRHGLGPPSSIQASLRSLISKGIVIKDLSGDYELLDGFMAYWILGVLRARGPIRPGW